MKKIFYFLLFFPILFTACSSDDDTTDNDGNNTKVNPAAVFTGGLPSRIGNVTLTYNDEGLLIKTTDGEHENTSFTYGNNTKATSQYPSDVVMKYSDRYLSYTVYMKLGSNGFVEKAIQVYDDEYDDTDTWTFEYNSDGQLTEMKRTEGDNETTSIEYKDGNIVKVSMVSEAEDDDNSYNSTISYTSESNENGIANKGCLMLFDETFGIDMDEMMIAYYAGVLGKATKQLPLQLVDLEDKETIDFEWDVNDKGYPTELSYTDGYSTDSYEFGW